MHIQILNLKNYNLGQVACRPSIFAAFELAVVLAAEVLAGALEPLPPEQVVMFMSSSMLPALMK